MAVKASPPLRITAARRTPRALQASLEAVYQRYARRCFVDPDPLAAVYAFSAPEDQEIAALISASLAFGNVRQILKTLDLVFTQLPHPAQDLRRLSTAQLARRFRGFQYRYIREQQMLALLTGVQAVVQAHGSLGRAFALEIDTADETIAPALSRFITKLDAAGGVPMNYLLPSPARGSACKRLFLFLRWMIRKDEVDLGLWPVSPRLLVVPLDTHMHRMALALGMTRRKQASLATALEVTAGFRKLHPEDPVRYDFALTRIGIRKEVSLVEFLAEF